MAELTPKERLQPSLLDRLTDDEPDQLQESREKRVLSMSRLRDYVLRDLAWLFNADAPLESDDDMERYPFAARSVINFGIPPLAGLTIRILDLNMLENLLRQSVIDFEPRILGIVCASGQSDRCTVSHNALTFEIEGELWGQPLPQQLYLKTEIDLESGQVKIEEETRRPKGR